MKLRINAGDKTAGVTQDNAIADTYGNKFIIPLNFEMLDSASPYYQVGLRNRLSYELTFNDYNRVNNSLKTDEITDISLEYDIVTQPDLVRSIKDEYDKMVLLYDRVIQHSQIPVNKSDTKWNWSFNDTCKSLKGILVLLEEEKPYIRDTSKIEKVTITIESKPNQLYSQGMRSFEQYDEACKYSTEGRLANETQAQSQLYDLGVGEYLVNKYALWLDFRTIDENELHGMGRQIGNTSGGITIQIKKKAESPGALNAYIYLIVDAQLNIQNGAYISAVYQAENVYERTAYCIVRYSNWSRKNAFSLEFAQE